jgi:hypothetical protein
MVPRHGRGFEPLAPSKFINMKVNLKFLAAFIIAVVRFSNGEELGYVLFAFIFYYALFEFLHYCAKSVWGFAKSIAKQFTNEQG